VERNEKLLKERAGCIISIKFSFLLMHIRQLILILLQNNSNLLNDGRDFVICGISSNVNSGKFEDFIFEQYTSAASSNIKTIKLSWNWPKSRGRSEK